MKKDSIKLHPKVIVSLIVVFIGIITIIGVLAIILNGKNNKVIENFKAKTINENMKIGEANEGILEGAEENSQLMDTNVNDANSTEQNSNESNEIGNTGLGAPLRSAPNIPSSWDLTKVDAVEDAEGNYVPVPKGFTASSADGENSISSGLVIYEGTGEVNNDNYWDESKTRNQFVWVPVNDTSRVYSIDAATGKKIAKLWNFNASGRTVQGNATTNTRREPGVFANMGYDNIRMLTKFNFNNSTRYLYYRELQKEFDSCMDSIEKYGGFYIGRYETGNISSNTPVVRRYNTDLSSFQAWYTMYNRMKNISSNENVQTGMIWGCLWDETMEWFIESGNKTRAQVGSDSSDWGSFSNVSFQYTNASGSTYTKSANTATKIPTGSAERNQANNVYDMAGNVYDWTLESDGGTGRVQRGGNYYVRGSWTPAGGRSASDPTLEVNSYGFRAYLYIK